MKRFVIFLLCIVTIIFAQNAWFTGEDVVKKNNNAFYVSDKDSVFFDEDTLYICGAETIEVYVNMDRSLGMVRLFGTVQSKDTMGYSSTGDSIYFYVARHKGLGQTRGGGRLDAKNANITETFYAIDSVEQANGTVGTFDVYPLSNSTLKEEPGVYYTFRIYGVAHKNSAIWLKEELIYAY